ncbi:hypothetical protein [Niameybacter massiliensis]|uniref:hypothetical protein n=1 Tax=Niameybacter massiliensis TaxID=1658108 RepID=UPI0006B53E08|nr:hypothetical protein [Niameybacter massiliensis]
MKSPPTPFWKNDGENALWPYAIGHFCLDYLFFDFLNNDFTTMVVIVRKELNGLAENFLEM